LEQFLLEEIKEVVYGVELNKAVNLDGFNVEFYQNNLGSGWKRYQISI
jgi:hypothetical protein